MPRRLFVRVQLVALLVLGALLVGCGGGDDEGEEKKTTDPPDCEARPDLCV